MERGEGAPVLSGEREVKVGEEDPQQDAGEAPKDPTGRRAWLYVFFLVVVPGLFYAAVLGVPFLPLATGTKIWVSAALIVAAEATFVVSVLLLGKEVVSRYRRYLDPRRLFGGR